jgi:hypothetical protein
LSSTAVAVKTLELFNEKADQLLSSEFFKQASGGGSIVEFNRESGWEGIHVGPDEESIRALVLTLRLFMQDNDRISLRNMANIYGSLPVSAAMKQEFDAHRSQLNALLDSKSHLAITEEGPLTYREILCIFVYGEYAHVGERYRQTYEDLRTTSFFPLFQNCLVDAVVAYARCIGAMQRTNLRAVAELTGSES